MTRHGIIQRSTAGYRPPATDPRAPMVTVDADRLTANNVRGRQYRAEVQRNCLSAPTSALSSNGHADADIGRRSKSP